MLASNNDCRPGVKLDPKVRLPNMPICPDVEGEEDDLPKDCAWTAERPANTLKSVNTTIAKQMRTAKPS